MKDIPDNSIDLVLTDPPYGTTACKWDTVIDFELMWEQLKRITKDNGAICLFGSEPFSSALRMSNIKMFKYDWIWHKNKPSGFALVKKQPMRNTENVSVFYVKQCPYYPIKESKEWADTTMISNSHKNMNITQSTNCKSEIIGKRNVDNSRKKITKLRYPTLLKFFKMPPNRSGRLHPTQKPVALLEYLIKTYTLENETVLDFTMGSGSTGVACKNLNRKFIGIEQDDKYFQIAKDRIND
tara:strand:+ start:193 stop:912 length:720 start_codon:yes stop_codon:yes gene_type:complete